MLNNTKSIPRHARQEDRSVLVWIIRVASIAAIAVATVPSDAAAASYPCKPLAGDAFYKQLVSPLSGSWSGVPLGDVVGGLSRAHKVSIVLDRRVDPRQPVSLQVSERPLIDVLAELARGHNLGLYLHGSIACLTQSDESARMEAAERELGERIARLPKAAALRWREEAPMTWKELTAPAELLSQLAEQGGFTIVNPRRLPHDLWAAGNLPRLALADRLSYILGQFGLTCEITPAAGGASRVKLVEIPHPPAAARSYPAGKDARLLIEKWKAKAKRSQKGSTTTGRKEIRIEKFAVSEVQLEPLLRQLASRLGLKLELDQDAIRSAGISLDRRVSVSLAGVTPDELFKEILSPLGLRAEHRGKTVRIGPK